MSEDQNPAEPVGDEDVRTDVEDMNAPLPDEVGHSFGQAPEAEPADEAAADGEAEEKPDDVAGDEAPPAEDEKSRSALRRERRRKHLEETEERLKEAESSLRAIRSAKDSDEAPKEADFSDYTDFAAAKAVWALERHRGDTRAAEAETQHRQAYAERNAVVQAEWQEQVEAAKATYPDFATVVYSDKVQINQAMTEVIQSSDKGADLAYYLGSHRDVSAKIAQMPPLAAARELGRIEANLSAPKPRNATKAPPPVRPV